MVAPRGPTFLLLCFPLIRQVEARDFIVNGATFGAGINPEEGEGADNQRQGWEFKDAGFLVVRGVEPQQNGVYQLVNASNGNPQFFRHMDNETELIIHRKDGGWALSRGLAPENASEVLFTSTMDSTSWNVWKIGDNVVHTMWVTPVSNAFNEQEMMEGDWEKDEGIICQGINNQRLFIGKAGSDPFYGDKKKHCPRTGMDESSIFADLTFQEPIFSAFGAVVVGILLFFVFRKSLKGRGERKRHRKVGTRLRR